MSATAGITRMDGPHAADGPSPATPACPPLPAAASEALSAAVASGALDPAAAAERLIEATVAAARPADIAPEAWAVIEREVSALLAGDPALADLLAPL